MSKVTLRSRPMAVSDLQVEELDGEILVHDPDTQKTYNFNGTGAFVWSLCDGSHELREIVRGIEEAAPQTPREAIEDDVVSFVEELEDDGLLSMRDE